MKMPTLCAFMLILAGPVLATPGFTADAPANSKETPSKDASKEKPPPKKKSESHTQERARQIQEFNRGRSALGH